MGDREGREEEGEFDILYIIGEEKGGSRWVSVKSNCIRIAPTHNMYIMRDTKYTHYTLLLPHGCENDKFNTLHMDFLFNTWGLPCLNQKHYSISKLLSRHAYSLNANSDEALFVYGVRSNVISHAQPISALFTVGISLNLNNLYGLAPPYNLISVLQSLNPPRT